MQAIETVYAGRKFRSRTEARWAVFFDALGLEWHYEVEGFELPSGRRYLPDFWLPECNTWFEVKGGASPSEAERSKLVEFATTLPGADLKNWPSREEGLATAQYLKVAVGTPPAPDKTARHVKQMNSDDTLDRPDPWSPGWVWRVIVLDGEARLAARWWNRCDYGHTWVGWGWCWRCQIEDDSRDFFAASWRVHPDINRALHEGLAARFEHDEREVW